MSGLNLSRNVPADDCSRPFFVWNKLGTKLVTLYREIGLVPSPDFGFKFKTFPEIGPIGRISLALSHRLNMIKIV